MVVAGQPAGWSWQAVLRWVTLRSVLLAGCRRVGDMGEWGDLHFCGDSGGCSTATNTAFGVADAVSR